MSTNTLTKELSAEILLGISAVALLLNTIFFYFTAIPAETIEESPVLNSLSDALFSISFPFVDVLLFGLGLITLGLGIIKVLKDKKTNQVSTTSNVLLGIITLLLLIPFFV